jgi:hypothetical protein
MPFLFTHRIKEGLNMLVDAVFDNGKIKLLQPLQFAHGYFRIQVNIPDEEIVTGEIQSKESQLFSDEYINNNWRELIMAGLKDYDEDYYKSDQYKEDRGAYLMEKHK